MNGIERRSSKFHEEIEALWVLWRVDPVRVNSEILRHVFEQIISSCYSFKLVFEMLLKLEYSSKSVSFLEIQTANRRVFRELVRLSETIRRMVPHISDDEFNEGFSGIIKGLGEITDPTEE